MTSQEALKLVLKAKDLKTVLDIGSGSGQHAQLLRNEGFIVTTLSLEPPADIICDFSEISEDIIYDAIWAAHVLEHQLNPGAFLKKCFRLLKNNGLFIVTVPPLKHEIVGGHVNLYNAGLLIYQCILAGFDCSQADVRKYDYNISLTVRKKEAVLPPLRMDSGDINLLAKFFPFDVKEGFNGDFRRVRGKLS